MVTTTEHGSTRNLVEALTREAHAKKWSHIFIFTNSILMILAVTLMSVMLGLEEYWRFFNPFLYIYREIHGFGVISTGCSIFICASFGYLICCTQKSSHFIWYGLGLLVMLVLDFKIIITGITSDNLAHRHVNRTLHTAFNAYHNHSALRNSVDTVQLSLMCCGINSHRDWFNTTTNFIPFSCCPFTNSIDKNYTSFCQDNNSSNIFKNTCFNKLTEVPEIGILLLYSIVTLLVSVKTLCLILTVKLEKIYKT